MQILRKRCIRLYARTPLAFSIFLPLCTDSFRYGTIMSAFFRWTLQPRCFQRSRPGAEKCLDRANLFRRKIAAAWKPGNPVLLQTTLLFTEKLHTVLCHTSWTLSPLVQINKCAPVLYGRETQRLASFDTEPMCCGFASETNGCTLRTQK